MGKQFRRGFSLENGRPGIPDLKWGSRLILLPSSENFTHNFESTIYESPFETQIEHKNVLVLLLATLCSRVSSIQQSLIQPRVK